MKSLLIGILGLGLLSTAAWADKPNHGNGGGGHHVEVSHAVHRTTAHRSSPVRHTTVRRTVTTHRANHHAIHKKVTIHRDVTVHRSASTNHRVNVAHFHKVFRAPHRYRIGAWHAPRGFAYRRFGIGERIPAVLLAADFFLTDYALYGLDVPDDGYVWVRDGGDAVLVDRYTGEVVEVEYDVFY